MQRPPTRERGVTVVDVAVVLAVVALLVFVAMREFPHYQSAAPALPAATPTAP